MLGDVPADSASKGLSSRERAWLIGLAAVTLVMVVVGWRMFYFYTDAAFASFRYISNARSGLGLIFNPPPFLPVEGYSSFLWLTLLRSVWWLTGLAPPQTANALSMLFGLGSIYLIARAVFRMALPEAHQASRLGFLALTMLGVVTNRTFLTWLSSGFETAQFNLIVTWWALEALAPPKLRGRWWLARMATASALAALTRIDGQAEVRATVVIGLLVVVGAGLKPRDLVQLLPIGAVLIHLLWRHATYGSWTPNGRVAELVSPWPQSGLRYTASFALEYGVWVWAILLVAWAVRAAHQAVTGLPADWRVQLLTRAGPAAVAVFALAWPVLFCTFVSGGDHFEYRTYSYLIPLLMGSAVWLAARVTDTPAAARTLVATFIFMSWPIPWTHFEFTHFRSQRGETYKMVVPIAGSLMGPLRWLATPWDELQAWLIPHLVCVRHQEHKVFFSFISGLFPPREEGSKVEWEDGHPVLTQKSVGVAGWNLPHVALIDEFGVNDPIIAGNPVHSYGADGRQLAHDRSPPGGYLACFRPDVETTSKSVSVTRRQKPLTDDDIAECESKSWY